MNGSMSPPPPPSPSWRPAAIGAVIGVLIAAFDVGLLAFFGVEMTVAGQDVQRLVFAVFALTYAVLGWVCGALWTTRRLLRREATGLRTANAALAEAREQLVRAETLAGLGRMAASVAHEVRNPLGVIRSAAGLVAEDLPPAGEAARAASFIVEEVDRLNAFVRRVLDLARPAAAQRTSMGLGDMARFLAERASIGLEDGAPLTVSLDRELLTTAVLSLVDNARQAGAEHIMLRTGVTPEGPYLEIADDGPGVPTELQPRLFEPFFTTRAEGTGLGLAMAARIARAHDGTLGYRDGEGLGPGGRGACFRFTLPADPVEATP